jgi:hypothetical protein
MTPSDGSVCPTPTKRSYARKRDAKRALRRGHRRAIMGARAVYRCACGRWHLTSQS